MLETLDIEGAIQSALAAKGMSASAPPVPATLGAHLPHYHAVRVGGWQENAVQDMHEVEIHTYAADEADAMAAANRLSGWIRALAGDTLDGHQVYTSNVTTLPYGNPDPLHLSLARATLRAQILTRTA